MQAEHGRARSTIRGYQNALRLFCAYITSPHYQWAEECVSRFGTHLGVTQSHSRPHVSNDNPYSEAQFKTLKYRPAFPARFSSIEAARAHCQEFFPWYNNEHRRGGLGLHTAADVHHGRAAAVQAGRAQVLDAAYLAHPERFVLKPPAPPELPGTSWINPPQEKEAATQ